MGAVGAVAALLPESLSRMLREGAGLLSSLIETDGLIELGETIVRVEPGDQVGFLGYADLL